MLQQRSRITASSPNAARIGGAAGIRRLLRSVRPTKVNPISHAQDRGRVLPNGLKPAGLGSRVRQRDAVAMLRETGNPIADFVAVEERARRLPADSQL